MAETGLPSAPATLPERLATLMGAAITIVAVVLASDLHLKLGYVIFKEQALSLVLGLGLAIVFLTVGVDGKPRPVPPWHDVIAALVGLAAGLYLMVGYPGISQEFYYRPIETFTLGVIVVPLVLEGLRRTAGWLMFGIVLCFVLYGFLGHLIPGQLQGRSKELGDLLAFLAVDNVGILGLPMNVIAKVVVLFVFMGQLLLYSGGSAWFTDLAAALMGRSRGGSAKIAVIASSLFGSISGSAVSNVVSTGVITIPLMKESGFPPHVAGAVEAVSSTGGQLLPPVMGVAAFLMAEFLDVPYRDVVIAAAVPALLYYVAVFVQVDLEAARAGIPPVPADRIPRLGRVMREGWQFIIPFVVLVLLLFEFNRTAEESALAAAGIILVLGVGLGYKGKRMTANEVWRSIAVAGRSSVDLIMIGGMAGVIIGVLTGSGLGFSLTFVLLQVAESSLILFLVITAMICIVLGMGMPTAGIYLLLATMAAPSLIKLGIAPMAAHLFVLYFGCLSMITPPVALASFAAANVAGSRPFPTGLSACRLGWTAFLLPFLFVASPNLLMEGEPFSVARTAATAFAGVWLASAGFMGYLLRPIGLASRILFILGGLSLVVPANAFAHAAWLNGLGVVLGAALVVREIRRGRKVVPVLGG